MIRTAQHEIDFEKAPIRNASEDAAPRFMEIIERINASILAGDTARFQNIKDEARALAEELNGGTNFGMSADRNSPTCVLEIETRAPSGKVPLWGQIGEFVIELDGIPVSIDMDGIFGIGFPAFSARQVRMDLPFPISETGYRHFFGPDAEPIPVDAYVASVIREHLQEKEKKPGKRRASKKTAVLQ
jgi:hypothetical protein